MGSIVVQWKNENSMSGVNEKKVIRVRRRDNS